jgi:catechol 2,3-dioxygenase-like lactoylglutathione lyase family enzyme
VVRIVDVLFPASDPEALATWYEETIGAGPSFVSGETSPHHFAFHAADLEPWKQRLDVGEEHDFSSWGGARAVYFRDPEQNVAELIARPQARPELSIAEVGLPVEDVPAAVEALQRELDVPTYDDWDENFAPLGDDDGLLIVVRVGRGWFPVGAPSGSAPIEVRIAGAGSGEVEVPGSRHRVVGET